MPDWTPEGVGELRWLEMIVAGHVVLMCCLWLGWAGDLLADNGRPALIAGPVQE